MNRLSVVPYEVRWCERCGRDTRHSTNGRCLELHRGKPLSRGKRLRYERPQEERDRWAETKAVVFERDGFRCQFPTQSSEQHDKLLDAHHRRIKGHGGVSDDEHEYGLAGLVTLCRHHHNIVHTHRELAERMGFVIPRFPGDTPESVPVTTSAGRVYLLADGSRVAAAGPGGAT